MAYLKGGSYVDGDLYVEGALKVNKVVNSVNDYFPYLSIASGSKQDYLVIFGDNTGGIRFSPVKITKTGTTSAPTITFSLSTNDGSSATDQIVATTASWVIKNINPKNIEVDTAASVKLSYTTEIPRWEYV